MPPTKSSNLVCVPFGTHEVVSRSGFHVRIASRKDGPNLLEFAVDGKAVSLADFAIPTFVYPDEQYSGGIDERISSANSNRKEGLGVSLLSFECEATLLLIAFGKCKCAILKFQASHEPTVDLISLHGRDPDSDQGFFYEKIVTLSNSYLIEYEGGLFKSAPNGRLEWHHAKDYNFRFAGISGTNILLDSGEDCYELEVGSGLRVERRRKNGMG